MPALPDCINVGSAQDTPELFVSVLCERVTILWFDHTNIDNKSGAGLVLTVNFDGTKAPGPTASVNLNISGQRKRTVVALQSIGTLSQCLSIHIGNKYEFNVPKIRLCHVDISYALKNLLTDEYSKCISFFTSVLPTL